MWPTKAGKWDKFVECIPDPFRKRDPRNDKAHVSSVMFDGYYLNVAFQWDGHGSLSKYGPGYCKSRGTKEEDKKKEEEKKKDKKAKVAMDPGRGRDIVTCSDTQFNINKASYYQRTAKTYVEERHNQWSKAENVKEAMKLLSEHSLKVLTGVDYVQSVKSSWKARLVLLETYAQRKYADVRYYARTREQAFWDS
jgi:hypothetical protein